MQTRPDNASCGPTSPHAVTGRDGTVKECISANDYEIEVTFTLISTADEYPAEAMRQLTTLAREK